MKTVVELCLSMSFGGLELRFADDVINLTECGHHIIPVVSPSSPLVHCLQQKGFDPSTIKSWCYLDPRAIIQLVRIFKRNKVNTIHLHRTQDLGLVLIAADLAGVENRVFTLRMESRRRKKDPYHRWAYSRLTTLLTITGRMRKIVISNVAVNPDKVRVLRNGFDMEKLISDAEPSEIIRARWGIPSDAFVVGIVGRLEPGKRQQHLLKAGSLLLKVIPNLTIVIVGEETVGQKGEQERLKAMAAEFEIADRVVFTGYQNPPGKIVPAFDISVLASKKETFGNVIAEAMALGVPVIATDAGGTPELVSHGEDGILVPSEDPLALAKAIQLLYDNHDLSGRLAAAGSKKIQTKFSMETHISELETVLGLNRQYD